MAEISNDLIEQLVKTMQPDIASLKFGMAGTKTAPSNMRGTLASRQMDVHQIYTRLDRVDQRLDRIENRLELRELAEAQARFESHP